MGMRSMSFQDIVFEWCLVCHGKERTTNREERALRFMEESIELFQAMGVEKSKITPIIEYVYSRPAGDVRQEVGGVSVTLAALCNSVGIEMDSCAVSELKRVWRVIERIREKQKGKIQAGIGK